jgi:four helix bundle protein
MHTHLDTFKISKSLVLEAYIVCDFFPTEEKYGITQQIRRAAVSVHLNIAEGCSRRSIQERKRYFEISRGSVIEIDTALDIAIELKYLSEIDAKPLGEIINRCFQILSKMIST